MAYHGNCCVCVLTLCLCVFGCITTSTGVSLLMNAQLFGGNSSTPRTFPSGEWNQVVGITMTGSGSFMFFMGMFIAICFLTVGISEKAAKSEYESFDFEESPSTSSVLPIPDKRPPQNTAYDVSFTPQDDIVTPPPVKCPEETVKPRQAVCVPPSETGDLTGCVGEPTNPRMDGETEDDPHMDYPSVVLGEPAVDIPYSDSEKQLLFP